MTTIRDVAAACGVSPMTVSHVLNNGGRISAKTRERVLRAIREMDYQPGARETVPRRKKTTNMLGLMTTVFGTTFTEPGYFHDIFNSVLKAADAHEQNLILYTRTHLAIDPYVGIRRYCDGLADGLIVLAPPFGSPLVTALHQRGFPMVVIGDTGEQLLTTVDVDNVADARRLTEHLIQLGHRRIAFLGGPDFVFSSLQRQRGYREALQQAGLPFDAELERTNIILPKHIVEHVKTLFAHPETAPTAVFSWNDGTALQALETVRALGLRVPDDVSILGIDDEPATWTCDPPLTTLRQPYEAIGRQAVTLLLAQIRGETAGVEMIFLPGQIIVRASTGPPPRDRAVPRAF